MTNEPPSVRLTRASAIPSPPFHPGPLHLHSQLELLHADQSELGGGNVKFGMRGISAANDVIDATLVMGFRDWKKLGAPTSIRIEYETFT